jgi:hypothetical protein
MNVKTYIVEISSLNGDETTIFLEADGNPVDSLYAVIGIGDRGAGILDTGYRSIREAQDAWPDAVPPTPWHLTPGAIDDNFTMDGVVPGTTTPSLPKG